MKTYINYHVIITVLVVILSCSACSKKETGQPDVVCSMKNNRDEMLTVIANRDKIHDKDKFAEHLLQMYKDNAFDSMLFSQATLKCKSMLGRMISEKKIPS